MHRHKITKGVAVHAVNVNKGSGGIDPFILYFRIRWRGLSILCTEGLNLWKVPPSAVSISLSGPKSRA